MRIDLLPTLLLAALPLATHVSAQTSPRSDALEASTISRSWERLHGSRLRISTPGADGEPLVGRLSTSRADTLFLAVDGRADPVRVVADRNTVAEEWRRSHPTTGATLQGALLGALAGGILANALNEPPEPKRCEGGSDPWAAMGCAMFLGISNDIERGVDQAATVMGGLVLGGAIGALAGRALGKRGVREGWTSVSPSRLTVAPTTDGRVRIELGLTH